MKKILIKLKNKKNLNFEESTQAFEILMTGKASEEEIFDFLTLLSEKGEVAEEIAGGVHVLRNKSKRVNVEDCIDTCGTGGDGKHTLNISTASALLLASMGIKVAKHGNKAVSSKCGSGYHSAMKYVGPVRKKIGKRTIFNMIGPLSNPALVKRQVVGVFDKNLLKVFADGLKKLNIKFAWIVNSEDGLDEISPYAKSNIVQIKDGIISELIIDPYLLNINADKFENLVGDDAEFNANKIIDIFKGEDNDFSKAVCLNAAAGLIVAEKFTEFSKAYLSAREFILS
ncbi:MAG: anthranilate phosphoribosyltransferase, partial [Proteobacteria bacterium]|nr:anthranilate phosphoribosyltransferase [Pseudomonadota bacterium]